MRRGAPPPAAAHGERALQRVSVSPPGAQTPSPRAARALHEQGSARRALTRLGGPRVRLSWKAPSGERARLSRAARGRTVGQTSRPRWCCGRARQAHDLRRAGPLRRAPKCARRALRDVLACRAPAGAGAEASSRAPPPACESAGARPPRRRSDRGLPRSSATARSRARRTRCATRCALEPRPRHRVTVTAVDTRGHLGPASRALVIGALGPARGRGGGRRACPAASASSDSRRRSGHDLVAAEPAGWSAIVGYRVYRDEQLVGQTTATSMRLTHLSFAHTYTITVGAVDTDSAKARARRRLSLTHHAHAARRPALLSAEHVTDTSATLSWQAGSANGGSLVGYCCSRTAARRARARPDRDGRARLRSAPTCSPCARSTPPAT